MQCWKRWRKEFSIIKEMENTDFDGKKSHLCLGHAGRNRISAGWESPRWATEVSSYLNYSMTLRREDSSAQMHYSVINVNSVIAVLSNQFFSLNYFFFQITLEDAGLIPCPCSLWKRSIFQKDTVIGISVAVSSALMPILCDMIIRSLISLSALRSDLIRPRITGK